MTVLKHVAQACESCGTTEGVFRAHETWEAAIRSRSPFVTTCIPCMNTKLRIRLFRMRARNWFTIPRAKRSRRDAGCLGERFPDWYSRAEFAFADMCAEPVRVCR